MEGYKVFKPDWTCRGFRYSVGQIFEEDVEPSCCDRGFHFCKELKDCFNYYDFDPDNKVARVLALDDIDESTDDSKCCTNKILIVEQVSWEEVLRLVNLGKGNSGNRNSGDCNSGDWNDTSFSNGCFNTEIPKIVMFDKPSNWTYEDWYRSDARWILNQMPRELIIWVRSDEMTVEEKELHPECEVTGGYLKKVTPTLSRQMWFDSLSSMGQDTIKALPNFDAAIFERITGIKVTE